MLLCLKQAETIFLKKKDNLPEGSEKRHKFPYEEGLLDKVGKVMFGSRDRNTVGIWNEPKAPAPYEQIDSGMKELRTRLLEEIAGMNNVIEGERNDDLKPRKGWSKVWEGARAFLRGGSREKIMSKMYSPEIEKNRYLADRINRGDVGTIKKYLSSEVEKVIKLVAGGVTTSGDRGFEEAIIRSAQKDIDLLAKFDPGMANHLQKELDGKTGNPLARF